MNRFPSKFLFALLAITFVSSHIMAQFTVTFAKNVTPGQQNGIYYSLPQTMLQLDFIIRESVYEKGPLSDYAETYFDGADYIDYDATTYELIDVKMSVKACPDPNATFFVGFTNSRGGVKPEFYVLPNTIIRGVGTDLNLCDIPVPHEQTVCVAEAKNANGFMVLNSSGKSNSQLAKEVAEKIEEIRKSKYYLIAGDVEMATNPETFKMMYQKLDEMEQDYLSLLTGKRSDRTITKTLYVIPSKEVATQTVAKFSETEGLTSGTSGSGSPITVQTLSLNTTSSINAPSPSAIESMTYENKLLYRIPETANIKVTYQGNTLIEERMTVNQLGVMQMAPLLNTTLVFDTMTGQIVNMKMQ